MNKLYKSNVFLLIFSGFLFGCATAPTTFNAGKEQGQWEAKAQVKDLEKNKTETVSLEVIAQKDHALRMEVNGTMGIHVASLLMKNSDISYAIHTQKRFIYFRSGFGKISETSFECQFGSSLALQHFFRYGA